MLPPNPVCPFSPMRPKQDQLGHAEICISFPSGSGFSISMRLSVSAEIFFPHSLGCLSLLGFVSRTVEYLCPPPASQNHLSEAHGRINPCSVSAASGFRSVMPFRAVDFPDLHRAPILALCLNRQSKRSLRSSSNRRRGEAPPHNGLP